MTYKDNIRAILECYFTGFKEEIIDSACDRIVEQEPKIGHWIEHEIEDTLRWLECSNCHYETYNVTHNYCMNCGAKMTESEETLKSKWQKDNEIQKAYLDGANAVLDKIRAEIDAARFLDKDKKLFKNANASGLEVAMDIIDRYTKDGE